MSLILLDLAYITVKSISYLGYYTYQGLSTGITHGYEYFNGNNGNNSSDDIYMKPRLLIKNTENKENDRADDNGGDDNGENDDSFILIDGNSEYFLKQKREKIELEQLKKSLFQLKESLHM